MYEKIQEIHNSNLFGTIYEAGAGVGITNKLMSVPGASSTIFAAHSLYAESALSQHFGWPHNHKKFDRSVSPEAIRAVLRGSEPFHSDRNFKLVSSFQLPEGLGMSKHGWIGLRYQDSEKYYHITIPSKFTREEAIKEVANTGIKVLWGRNALALKDTYIDFIVNEDGTHDVDYTFETLSLTGKNVATLALVKDNKVVFGRLEKVLRLEYDTFFYRGSFNPWHEGHAYVRSVPDTKFVYPTLTVRPYGKRFLMAHELKDRALKLLYNEGMPIILTTLPYFKDFYELCAHKHGDKPIGFLMGDDTLKRVVECNDIDLFQKNAVKAICVVRKGYKYPGKANIEYVESNPHTDKSSTLIRTKK